MPPARLMMSSPPRISIFTAHPGIATSGRGALTFAETCREFRNEVRQWKQAVFTGREEYDHAFDSELRNAGSRLCAQAQKTLEFCQRFTGTCDPSTAK